MTPTVQVQGLNHRYHSTTTLVDVNLSFERGLTAVLGSNGAGKTTLLRILATVLAPTAGEVRLFGNHIRTHDQMTMARRRLGYVPQELTFARGFTAFGFVEYVAVLKEWTEPRTRNAEIRRVLELVDLGQHATTKVHRMSGGMRRRLAIAQSLLGSPDLLLLDEPTSGLDPEQRAALQTLLNEIRARATVIVATHPTEDIAMQCEAIIILDGGRVIYTGTVEDALDRARGQVWLSDRPDPVAMSRVTMGRFRNVGLPPPDSELAEPTLEDAYLLLRKQTERSM